MPARGKGIVVPSAQPGRHCNGLLRNARFRLKPGRPLPDELSAK
ncbi:MAG: hypothetical protein Q8S10_06200 [Thiobacillus sp.]|nr:hypothetical protein [Thiobacillus sp.]